MAEEAMTWREIVTAGIGRQPEEDLMLKVERYVRSECSPTQREVAAAARHVIKMVPLGKDGYKRVPTGPELVAHIKASRGNEFTLMRIDLDEQMQAFKEATTDEQRWDIVCSSKFQWVNESMERYAKESGYDFTAMRADILASARTKLGMVVVSVEKEEISFDKNCGSCASYTAGKNPDLGRCGHAWVGLPFGQIHKDSWKKALFTKIESETMVGCEYGCRYHKRRDA